MVDVSVVVVTYNSSIDKLINTLESIIRQENIKFEIIIADDGSKEFEKTIIEKWFKEHNFTDYKLILNKQNQGTLKNAYSGWSIAKGKYIKQLSPGDYLYSRNTLKNAIVYMEENNLSLGFGLAASYEISNNCINIVNKPHPKDLSPYYAKDANWIKYNYLVKKDYANGMCFVANKELLIKYSSMLLDKVKYAEDCTYILMVADDVRVGFIEEFIIWYEFGTGISTSNNDVWAKRIRDDNYNCFKVLSKLKPKYRFLFATFITNTDTISTKVVKKLLRFYYSINPFKELKPKNQVVDIPAKNPDRKELYEIIGLGGQP